MEPPARHAQDLRPDPPDPTSRLRITAYVAILTAITFTQAPGRIVADTKFDLSADPWAFLTRALSMWDAQGAFGQVQNQAIGYVWPMGPFYGLGQLAQLPEWVIQRLWWALLLNLAFFGVLTLARELRLGRPWAQVAGAAAYVLTPRVMTILGANSVELWPTAVAPWVLLAVIRASGTTTTKDLLRWCAIAALAVACAGGVNATAVSAVLVPGIVFLLTRTGWRRFAVLGLWGALTVVATLWWTIPLVLQGRYIPPFLDYIETAAVTASTTGLLPTLLGTSDWVAYADPVYYPAGQSLHTTPYLILDAAAVVAIGLAGLAGLGRTRRHPESRFLIGCVLAGAVLVGIGYTGALAGWGAEARQDLVDGALAAVRNSHKYDAVLRLGLAAGVVLTVETILFRSGLARADATSATEAAPGTKAAEWLRKVFVVAVVASLAGLAVPWVRGQVPPPGSIENVPGFWTDAADYLSETDDGGVTLVVPAARFGDYLWGSTHDEVLQPYARSRWAVRGVVPLAEPGNVVWLDRVTEELERGTPSAKLAPMLAKAGVTRLLVRNDLHWGTTGAPPPSLVHATLDRSAGLTRTKTFGSEFGNTTYHRENGTRVLVDGGLAGEYAPIEIYDVEDARPGASLIPARTTVMGDPGEPASGASAVLTADDTRSAGSAPEEKADVILTDGQRRRTTIFSGVRANSSSTRTAEEGVDSDKPESFHRYLEDQERWQSTMVWRGVEAVEASSSAATASEVPVDRGEAPSAAFDGAPSTSWRTETGWGHAPEGAWLRVRFEHETDLGKVTVSIPKNVVGVERLELVAGAQMRKVYAPQPGEEATYDLTGFSARNLTVTARGATAHGPWGISELDIEGVDPQRLVALPEPPADAAIRKIRLSRDADRNGCIEAASAQGADQRGVLYCEPFLASAGDDGDDLDRLVTLTGAEAFGVAGTASLRRDDAYAAAAGALAGVDIDAPSSGDIAQSALAMADGDDGTSWRAPSTGEAAVTLQLPERRRLRSLQLEVGEAAPVSIPTEVEITDLRRPKRTITREVDTDGEVELPDGWRTDRLRIRITDADAAYDQPSSKADATEVPVGISELRVDGEPLGDGRLRASCADGPRIQVGDRTVRTSLRASLSDLLRGAAVPLQICGSDPVELTAGENTLVADPGTDDALRVDSLELSAQTIAPAEPPEAVEVERDERDAAVSANVSATTYDRVLVLPQNINPGATATLDGTPLQPQRVDGWQQGWVVPAGDGGEVRLGFEPEHTYRLGLLAGAGGAVLVLALALVTTWRRRSTAPRLELFPEAAPWRWYDAGVLAVVAGLLAGWWGALAAVVAWGLSRLTGGGPGITRLLAAGSGAALLAGALAVEILPAVWDLPWHAPSWTAQALSLAAVVLAAAAASAGPRERAEETGSSLRRPRNGRQLRRRITRRSKKM
ncbi:arabinofuranan 3-O-arabinosyltransferase [Nocardioides albertanoniae]|uniref:Arabinofuranan 3-O-arabinosyltransferase n=1 Tax=Nocardioides albertanoniae TaxID=1175486 RepID=A0A543A9D7_9ACTN|nr:alpha-(1->3)-arabinofuranosyltransferase family protein [Nocardioides albertanoniae]TQL69165.1 arabinofuranan 3-O-arabinosyltransferase [Nocardioides albertanoniae]